LVAKAEIDAGLYSVDEPLPAIARMLGIRGTTPFPIRLPLPQGPC